MGAGPPIPVEFARVSLKRNLALTLVTEPDHGADCATHAIESVRDDIHDAAEDLRLRERAPDLDFIGVVCMESGFVRASSARIAARIEDWCRRTGSSGAVWTDLNRNFHEATGEPFSLEAAVDYLKNLDEEGLAEAYRYIENAPPETDTPLRRHLSADPWWRSLGALISR